MMVLLYPVNPVDPVGAGFGQDLQDGFGFAAENAEERGRWRDWNHDGGLPEMA